MPGSLAGNQIMPAAELTQDNSANSRRSPLRIQQPLRWHGIDAVQSQQLQLPTSGPRRDDYTVEMPSIGLMSPTNLKRSAMVKSPGVFDGRVGFQFLPCSQRYD